MFNKYFEELLDQNGHNENQLKSIQTMIPKVRLKPQVGREG